MPPAGTGRRPRFFTQSLEGLSPGCPSSLPTWLGFWLCSLAYAPRSSSPKKSLANPAAGSLLPATPCDVAPQSEAETNAAQAICPHRAAIRSSAAPDVPKKEAHQAVTKGKNQRYEPLEKCAMPRLSKKRRRGNYRRARGQDSLRQEIILPRVLLDLAHGCLL